MLITKTSKAIFVSMVFGASATFAAAQGARLPPQAVPGMPPVQSDQALEPKKETTIKPIIETPTVSPPKSGYPKASDIQGISLGDVEADVRRKAAKLGFRLSAEDRFNSEGGLPERIARISFVKAIPNTFLQEELGVAFTSTTSKVVVVSRTLILQDHLHQSTVKQQLEEKYGRPSRISKDGISSIAWESDLRGNPFPNAGARCTAPRFSIYTLKVFGAKPLCETAIEVRTGTDARTGLVTNLRINMIDRAASAADYLRMIELVKADRDAAVNRAGQAGRPSF